MTMCDSASHKYICVSGGTAFQDCHFFRAGLVRLYQYKQLILKNNGATYELKRKIIQAKHQWGGRERERERERERGRKRERGKKERKNAILHYSDCARNCDQGHLNVTEILSQTSVTNFIVLFYFNFPT
jgi:hypothetical protein